MVVDDDVDARRLLTKFLTAKGFLVTTAEDGETAFRRVLAERPDLVLLDVNMPQTDGWTVLERLRAGNDTTPVIMVTVLDNANDKVRGLASGADDYITKPFNLKELDARVRAVLRRTAPSPADDVLKAGGLVIDHHAKRVRAGDEEVSLSPKEYELLRLLASSPGRVYSPKEILKAVWPERVDASGPEDVKKYIYLLRNKLKPLKQAKTKVQTVRGFGYSLEVIDQHSEASNSESAG